MVSGLTKLGYFRQNLIIIFIIVSGNEKKIQIQAVEMLELSFAQ